MAWVWCADNAMTSLRRYLQRYLPARHELFQNRYLRWLAPWLDRPAYWAMNRRKVAMAVAVGLFAGLMPGPTQMLTAAVLALWWRVNLPVAMLTTLYTNPLTFVPLYYLAYAYGRLLLGAVPSDGRLPPLSASLWTHPVSGIWEMGQWLMALGRPLLVGVLALGITLGLIGYVTILLCWRWHVLWVWKQRKARRGSG